MGEFGGFRDGLEPEHAGWEAGLGGQVLSPVCLSVMRVPELAFVGLIFSLGILAASE